MNKKVTKVKVTNCKASGKRFKNLTPNSVHDVVTPPDGHENGRRGYWVMGIGEPVLLLHNEYEVVKRDYVEVNDD